MKDTSVLLIFKLIVCKAAEDYTDLDVSIIQSNC